MIKAFLITIVILLVISIIFKISRYRRIDHTHTTYNDSPLRNKFRRGKHYQNNRPNINDQRRPMNSTFERPREAMAGRPNEPMFERNDHQRPNQPMNNRPNGSMGQAPRNDMSKSPMSNGGQRGSNPAPNQNPNGHRGNF